MSLGGRDPVLTVTDNERLIGWLCFARHQWSNNVECVLPTLITRRMIQLGWMCKCDGTDGCTGFNAHLTDKGTAMTDMHAPEWGIDPLKDGGV